MALQRTISRARNRQLIGREFPVLVEGPSQETELLWEARLSTQAPEIDGVCYINDFGAGDAAAGRNAHACASPKRTITIWSANWWTLPSSSTVRRRSGEPIPDSDFAPVSSRVRSISIRHAPTCVVRSAKRSRIRRSEHAVLQRSLPDHRSRQLGIGEVRDSRRREPIRRRADRTPDELEPDEGSVQ